MGRRTKDHAILVAREESNKAYIRNHYEITGFKTYNRIVVSKYYPSPFKGPQSWRYQGVLARGKEYRQLRKVDPHFNTYVGRVGNW